MGKAKGNALLINSPDYDSLFTELVSSLEDCSRDRGDCSQCALEADCRKAFDNLMNTRTHYKLKPEDVELFRARFTGLKKQMVLC